jgi:hypothetical protein
MQPPGAEMYFRTFATGWAYVKYFEGEENRGNKANSDGNGSSGLHKLYVVFRKRLSYESLFAFEQNFYTFDLCQ